MYRSKTEPFHHQSRALSAASGRPGFGYLMEMGTGKTKVLIDEAGKMFSEGTIDALLVIAPKGVCRTWLSELETHLGCEYRAEVWESSPNKTRERILRGLLSRGRESGLTVVVMNVEAFGAGKKAGTFAEKFLGSHRSMLAVDESQTIKNPSAKRTKTILALNKFAVCRRIMTGTPAPNSPMDLYSQMEFISPGSTGQRSFYAFRARYAVLQRKSFGGRSVSIEVGYRNLDELQARVARHSFRVRKDECLDLLPKLYAQRDVELTSEQSRVYRQMSEEALAEIGGSFTSSQAAITTLIRLQQIVCGYVRDDDGNVHMLDSRRVQAVVDIAEQTDEDIIVWVGAHTPMIPVLMDTLQERFGEGCCAAFWGGNVRSRDREAREFMDNPSVRFMVATQAAGGRGNTWVNARQVVYFANTYNLEHRLQSEDRNHRAGQRNVVTYTDITASGVNIDEKLVSALRRKESISALLVGESAREWI